MNWLQNDPLRLSLVFALLLTAGCSTTDQPAPAELSSPPEYRSPLRFEKAVRAFEAADQADPPPVGAVVCVGSSSIRMWHKQIADDLAPLTVIPRGFGGSNMNDLLHYTDRLVLKHKPRAVLIYEGDNDLAQGMSPADIVTAFRLLMIQIDRNLPGCRVYLLAVKPSPRRWHLWPQIQELNSRFEQIANDRGAITYIDIATPMLGPNGKPKPDIFVGDKLHMNRKGYELWRDAVRPVLVEAERKYEKKD